MEDDQGISMCDIMQKDSSKIINKLELVGPAQYQLFSDIYTDHLQFIKKMFGVCFMSEKRFFDTLDINEEALKSVELSSNHITKIVIDQVENYSKCLELYAQIRVEGMESYKRTTSTMMEIYFATLDSFSK